MSNAKDRLKRHTKIVAEIMRLEKELGFVFDKRVPRNRWIRDTYKTLSGCQNCEYNLHPSALQFDHIDPSTKFRAPRTGKLVNPSDMVAYATHLMLHEFTKCQVLCANCHAIHTHTVQRVKVNLTLAA